MSTASRIGARHAQRRPGRRWGLSPVVACVLLFLIAAPLAAHQWLRSSSPADEARLDRVPDVLRLVFSEPVQLGFTSVTLEDAAGAGVELGSSRTLPDSTNVLVLDIAGRLAAGTHTVRWRTVGLDGHATDGSFTFTIEPDAAGLAPPSPADPPPAAEPPAEAEAPAAERDPSAFHVGSPLYVAIRWARFAALLVLIGGVVFHVGVAGALRRRRTETAARLGERLDRGVAVIGATAAALLLVAAAARLPAQIVAVSGGGTLAADQVLALLTDTLWGRAWLVESAAAGAALAGFVLASRRIAAGWMLAGIGALALAFTPALSGHAITARAYVPAAVFADALHLLGAAGWLGSLTLLVAVGIPAALRIGEGGGRAAAEMVDAFSPVALVCAAAVAVTGLFAAWLHLGGLDALWDSAYGRILLAKLSVLGLVAVNGAYNWLRMKPSLRDAASVRRLRVSAGLELGLAAVVVLFTAMLVATPRPVDEAPPAMAVDEPPPATAVEEVGSGSP